MVDWCECFNSVRLRRCGSANLHGVSCTRTVVLYDGVNVVIARDTRQLTVLSGWVVYSEAITAVLWCLVSWGSQGWGRRDWSSGGLWGRELWCTVSQRLNGVPLGLYSEHSEMASGCESVWSEGSLMNILIKLFWESKSIWTFRARNGQPLPLLVTGVFASRDYCVHFFVQFICNN